MNIYCVWWLRLVGSLKLEVSFAKYRLFYRALLQKRPVVLRSLLIVGTPYVYSETLHAYCVCFLIHTLHVYADTLHTSVSTLQMATTLVTLDLRDCRLHAEGGALVIQVRASQRVAVCYRVLWCVALRCGEW